MNKTSKNIEPIDINVFSMRVSKNIYRLKGYYSLYITPLGDILDCRFPEDLGHNDFSVSVYSSLDDLPKQPFNSNLRGLSIDFKDLSYYLLDYFNLLDIMYVDADLYTKIDKVLLSTEDRICQDMGFVKVAINSKLKTFEVVVPNSIFEKKVTGAQKDTIKKLSEIFNLDLVEKLKIEQQNNSKLATEIIAGMKTLKKVNE